jgi:hypothetical protein
VDSVSIILYKDLLRVNIVVEETELAIWLDKKSIEVNR